MCEYVSLTPPPTDHDVPVVPVLEGQEVREEGVARQGLREVALRGVELGAIGPAVNLLEVAPQRSGVVA